MSAKDNPGLKRQKSDQLKITKTKSTGNESSAKRYMGKCLI